MNKNKQEVSRTCFYNKCCLYFSLSCDYFLFLGGYIKIGYSVERTVFYRLWRFLAAVYLAFIGILLRRIK